MGEIWRRLRYLLNRGRHEQDLADEMRLHRDLVGQASGLSSKPRSFGNVTQLHESSRAVWIWPFLETFAQDARYALRTLRANPGFAATAVFSLALGIGANTAIFSILNAVMLRSLPVEDPQRLVQIGSPRSGGPGPMSVSFTNPIWEQVRDRQQAFSGTLAYSTERFDLAAGGESQFAEGLWASGDFFHVLGVPAMRGRIFTLDDDLHGGGHAGPVAVISHGFWKRHFGGASDIVGKTIRLDRHSFTIVGVTPPWFTGLDVDTAYEVAIPIGCEPILRTDRSALADRSWWWLRILGRLTGGETPRQAEAKMKALAPEVYRATLPPDWGADGRQYLQRSFAVDPAATGFSDTGSQYRAALFTLMAVVGLVLLIACANIANLLLARAAARQREISIRMAIGAARRRVIRQLMSESLLLSVIGAVGGLLFAVWGSRLLVRFLSKTGSELQLDTAPDLRVLAFTMGVAVLTGLLFGLAPALRATRVSSNNVLKEHARSMAGGRLGLVRALVTGQVALSLMLLVGAGLFLGTLRNLLNTDMGFTRRNILLVRANMMQAGVPIAQRPRVYQEIVERMRAIPGVSAASSSAMTPIGQGQWDSLVTPEGYSPKQKDDTLVYFNRVSPGYFATMRQPLLLGRDFSMHDDSGASKVMLITESVANRFFGKASPIGKTIGARVGRAKQEVYQVVGVVKDAKYAAVDEGLTLTVYLACAQDASPWSGVHFEVRSERPVETFIPAVRAAIGEVNRGISLEFRNLETQVNESLLQPRMVALLSAFFGGLALLLAMIGLYGVTAYGVARRQAEIGIRMALGAQPGSVVWLVLREVAAMLAVGTALGLGASLAAGRLVASLLYGVKSYDAAPLAIAAVVLGIATGIAAYLPARRAARLDPMAALREE